MDGNFGQPTPLQVDTEIGKLSDPDPIVVSEATELLRSWITFFEATADYIAPQINDATLPAATRNILKTAIEQLAPVKLDIIVDGNVYSLRAEMRIAPPDGKSLVLNQTVDPAGRWIVSGIDMSNDADTVLAPFVLLKTGQPEVLIVEAFLDDGNNLTSIGNAFCKILIYTGAVA